MPVGTVSGQVSLNAQFFDLLTDGKVSPQNLPFSASQALIYHNGTGAGQTDTIYAGALPLAASTPQTLNLLSFLDASGTTTSFARVREMFLWTADPAHGFAVGGAGSNPFTGFFSGVVTVLPGGGIYRFSDPSSTGSGVGAVVTSLSSNLKLDPGSNAVVACFIIDGSSVA